MIAGFPTSTKVDISMELSIPQPGNKCRNNYWDLKNKFRRWWFNTLLSFFTVNLAKNVVHWCIQSLEASTVLSTLKSIQNCSTQTFIFWKEDIHNSMQTIHSIARDSTLKWIYNQMTIVKYQTKPCIFSLTTIKSAQNSKTNVENSKMDWLKKSEHLNI